MRRIVPSGFLSISAPRKSSRVPSSVMSNLALCISLSGDCTDVSILSATNSVAGLTPEKKYKISGVMVIETKLEVKKEKEKIIASSITCVFCQSFNVKVMENTL